MVTTKRVTVNGNPKKLISKMVIGILIVPANPRYANITFSDAPFLNNVSANGKATKSPPTEKPANSRTQNILLFHFARPNVL